MRCNNSTDAIYGVSTKKNKNMEALTVLLTAVSEVAEKATHGGILEWIIAGVVGLVGVIFGGGFWKKASAKIKKVAGLALQVSELLVAAKYLLQGISDRLADGKVTAEEVKATKKDIERLTQEFEDVRKATKAIGAGK